LAELFWVFKFVAAFMPKIKTARSITVDTLCDFSEADKMQKVLLSISVLVECIIEYSLFNHNILSAVLIDVS